jgi:hypothetical protein
MSKDGDVRISVPPGELKLTGYPPDVIVNKINEAIEISSDIPPDAKKAAKDFIKENIDEILNRIGELTNFDVPHEISDCWQQIVEIIRSVLGG